MPPRNLNVILLASCISLLCYLTHRRAKTAMMVGDALQMIHQFYVDPVDEKELLIAAMNGMTSTLDQHSEFIPIDSYESFQDSMDQEFAGIGIYVEQPDIANPVRVITPLVGSPALRAGMMPGDRILKVNGEDVSKMNLKDVSDRLKGPIGTVVYVVVERDKDDGETDELTLSIDRARIELESVIGDYRKENGDWVYRLVDDNSIAYVRLTTFGEKTIRELQEVLQSLDNKFEAIVLDLRGNSGGLLYTAIDVCNMFIEDGRIVSTRVRGGRVEEEYDAESGVLVNKNKPVAVLIDEDSASASEIVAACLQDHDRAIVVGRRSYGKGTVQNILPLQYGRSALRLTVAKYYRPSGENIHRALDAKDDDAWGVMPDEGMTVTIDDATREKLAKRWKEASYPSLASAESLQPDNLDSARNGDVEEQEEDLSGGLSVDPVLRHAVDALREISESEGEKSPQRAAA